MKRCITCEIEKPLLLFPSPGALMCNACTPVSDELTRAIHGRDPQSGYTLRERLRLQLPSATPDDPAPPDSRSLIDIVQEASFRDDDGLMFIKDGYGLRTLLRKAHRFVLDDATSALVGEFSLAVAQDIEGARRLAVPPFPVTWFEINNRERVRRLLECGLDIIARGATRGDAIGETVERVGWLIHPAAGHGGYYATYFTAVPEGVLVSPLSYWWHNDEPRTLPAGDLDNYLRWLCFGMKTANVSPADCCPTPTPLHIDVLHLKGLSQEQRDGITDLMEEIAGEARHIFGLLLALGAGQHGVETTTSPQPPRNDAVKTMPNGKPLLPLEHKVLHLHLNKKIAPKKVALRAITNHKRRLHEVRAHWRTYRNDDGSVRRRTLIHEHRRGDERLGRIEKTYRVER
jgi:hypothetical protein